MTEQSGKPAPKPRRSRKPKQEAPAPIAPAAKQSKKDQLLALLQRKQGATLEEMITTTSWLKHTTRAALTGLRKAGHAIEKGKRDDITCYSIKAEA